MEQLSGFAARSSAWILDEWGRAMGRFGGRSRPSYALIPQPASSDSTQVGPDLDSSDGAAVRPSQEVTDEELENETKHGALEKQLVHRLDRRLMPVLFVMIILNYLDRNALPNARLQGIESDLGLRGSQYNSAISVLFIGYIGLQIPSNMLLTRVRPSIYLPTCMALWGAVSASTALCTDFHGLLITRFLLGFLEAPFFAGALFLLSSWYTKHELATRTAILYSGSLLSGGFGGLIGAAVQYSLDGFMGLHSWQWLFMLEGTLTVVVSVISIRILPDFPPTTRWLTAEEREIAVGRLQDEGSSTHAGERGSVLSGVRLAVGDYKVWLLAAVVLTKTSAAAVTSFIPTLVAGFEFSRIQSLLMVAPPYVCAAAVALGVSISSDNFCERYSHLVLPLKVGAAGFVIAAWTTALVPRYCALFLMLGGVYGGFNVGIAWISSTLPAPLEKRAAALALINMVGNFAQIYSPYLYDKSTGPRYMPAMVTNTIFVITSIGFATVLRVCLARENLQLEKAERAQAVDGEHPAGFRYVL